MARRFRILAQVLPQLWIAALAVAPVFAQFQPALPPPPPEPNYAEPPEEDRTLAKDRTYSFNPLQAKKEIQTGDFYLKRGNARGAAMRYREATMWDDGSIDAFYKWGEASEKLKDYAMAREAFEGFLKLEPDSKRSGEVRKRMQGYPADTQTATSSKSDLEKLKQSDQQDRQVTNRLREKGIYRR